eukprot:CAMPEP_0118672118 /NCGR_PEP_ID=MMETSP0785-20121206/22367_1 /TAXON_ID=91992 /ORGANISM="Bolidomonas pacifica, Strain CCMP 1866" /LENGTH=307 /DNA_ID=CAMNT_0006567053 /DNA_START=87 /DNA_END=1007 /DNA_ORIENTATION=+
MSNSMPNSMDITPPLPPSTPLYLVHFVHRHLDFRMCEFDSSIHLSSLRPSDVYKRSTFSMIRPFLICTFPSDSLALEVVGRCVLVKGVGRLLGTGKNEKECRDNAVEEGRIVKMEKDKSWKFNFTTFGWKHSKSEQMSIINQFIPLVDFGGPVRMKGADVVYEITMEYPVTIEGEPVKPRHDHNGREIKENMELGPMMCYFTRFIGMGGRGMGEKYKLTKRKYLGPTSMDNEISMVMCLAGLVGKTSYVCDPFVGTGSILFTATVMGAQTIGMDIDTRVLLGAGKEGDVFTNFSLFNLPRPDVVRMD